MRNINHNFNLAIISQANKPMAWYEAQEYCKKQGGRLPTIEELQILSALQRQGKINTDYSGWFWSSLESTTHDAWIVLFGSGYSGYGSKDDLHGVLCVGN